jgi:hypothetical protein
VVGGWLDRVVVVAFVRVGRPKRGKCFLFASRGGVDWNASPRNKEIDHNQEQLRRFSLRKLKRVITPSIAEPGIERLAHQRAMTEPTSSLSGSVPKDWDPEELVRCGARGKSLRLPRAVRLQTNCHSQEWGLFQNDPDRSRHRNSCSSEP